MAAGFVVMPGAFMSSKWPVNLFGYHPRVPVGADAADAPPTLDPAPAPPDLDTEGLDVVDFAAPDEDEATLVERARTNPEAFGHLYEIYVSASILISTIAWAMCRTPKT
jgi:hypothetical protein